MRHAAVREGEVPYDGGTAVQEDPARPVFRGNGADDYVCVECGNVLATAMDPEHMTYRVRVQVRPLPDGQRRGRATRRRRAAARRASGRARRSRLDGEAR